MSKITSGLWLCGLCLAAAPTVWAQKSKSEENPSPAQNASHIMKTLEKVREAILKELELDDEQADAIEDLFDNTAQRLEDEAKHREKNSEATEKAAEELKTQMQKARDEKDWDTYRQLKEQLRTLTDGGHDIGKILEELKGSVRQLLDEDQEKQLEAIIARHRSQNDPRSMEALASLMSLMQVMDSLDVDPEQKKELKKLRTRFMSDMKDLDKSNSESVEQRREEMRQEIIKQLDPGQVAEFEKAEARALAELKSKPGRLPAGRPKPEPGKPQNDKHDDHDDDHGEDDEDEEQD